MQRKEVKDTASHKSRRRFSGVAWDGGRLECSGVFGEGKVAFQIPKCGGTGRPGPGDKSDEHQETQRGTAKGGRESQA